MNEYQTASRNIPGKLCRRSCGRTVGKTAVATGSQDQQKELEMKDPRPVLQAAHSPVCGVCTQGIYFNMPGRNK